MKIIDLTSNYIEHILDRNDLPAYEKSYPALLRHYFDYWADRRKNLKRLTASEVTQKSQLIKGRLGEIEERTRAAGFDCGHLDIALFVGQSTSNGHAFKDGSKFVVWVPIETYDSILSTDVFITHEIVHALHYAQTPDFYFENKVEKQQVSRQVITEGMATYLTVRILDIDQPVALWADYVPKEQVKGWVRECSRRKLELYQFVLDNFWNSSPDIELFYANDPKDIFKFRAGYYVGLGIIEQITKLEKVGLSDLLSMPRKKMEPLALRVLQSFLGHGG